MSEAFVLKGKGGSDISCSPSGRVTRSLLGYGLVAGPFYVPALLGHALCRPGFDLLRDDASLLSNGSFGWVQIANFLLTGAMVIAFAVGLRRALTGGRGAVWAPILVAVYGLGLVGAGIFVADPMNGFPAGAPAGRPDAISVHGILHIASAAVGFLSFVAACFVLARRFAAQGARSWSAFSVVTGVAFLAAFVGVASGSASSFVILGFWAALIVAWSWMGAVALLEYRGTV